MSNDIVSQLVQQIDFLQGIANDGVFIGDPIDTESLSGIAFSFVVGVYSDGVYALTFDESDTGSRDWTPVPVEKMIGLAVIDADNAGSGFPQKTGLFSTKRYVRIVVTATEVTDGVGIMVVVSIKQPKITPEAPQ